MLKQCDKTNANPIESCASLKRLIEALQTCQKLDVINNINDQNTFIKFFKQTYTELLNDYHHLVNEHQYQLEKITKYLLQNKTFGVQCTIKSCDYTSRHCINGFDFDKTDVKSDLWFNFYRETMDSLHFYLLHLFDTGFRVEKDKRKNTLHANDAKENTTDIDQQLFDPELSRIYVCIKDTINITKEYSRLKNNKFRMQIDLSETQIDSETTELDEMLKYISTNRLNPISPQTILKLSRYINDEEFDSESITMDNDLYFHQNENNISLHMRDLTLLEAMTDFQRYRHIQASSFGCGYTFYYWKDYKKMNKLTDNVNDFNCIDSRYSPAQLSIAPKYKTFKEEMMNYQHFNMETQNKVHTKVMECMATNVIKVSKARYPKNKWRYVKLRYEVKAGQPMSEDHVRSLVLYTDCTNLCTEFSSSFRAMTNYESLESIKTRNSCYFWMSKHLRELVEIFGDYASWKEDKAGQLKGPFYCGLSFQAIFPEFEMRLSSPTSTSTSKAVGIKFNGGGNGIVLQLNNTVICHQYLRGFSCQSISAYKEESEVLFFGGHYQIRIESVTNFAGNSALNYEEYFAALNRFGSIFDGGSMMYPTENQKTIIMNMINWKLGNKCVTYDRYICNTFELFTKAKTKIVFCLNSLLSSPPKIRNVVLYTGKQRHWSAKWKHTDSTNLFRCDNLLRLFDNLETIEILSTSVGGARRYGFSFFHLIQTFPTDCSSSLKQVVIKASRRNDNDSWLCSVWSKFQDQLREKCKQKNLQIEHKKKSGKPRLRFEEDSIVLETMPNCMD